MASRSTSQASNRPAQRSPRRHSPPGYPVSVPDGDEPSMLSPEQIPVADSEDRALPSDVEVAEALGVDAHELSDEIRDVERQRHADVQGDVEHTAGLTALADEFDRRMAEGSR